ncbi:hypothetical protein GC169_04250 [bacterium]|nr:hypothetical protein [bacterium]
MSPRLRLLLLAAAGLAVVAVIDVATRSASDNIARPVAPSNILAPAAATAPAPGVGGVWRRPPPLDVFQSVFSAPLFDPDRAPAAVQPAAAESTPASFAVAGPDVLSVARVVGVAGAEGRMLALVDTGSGVIRLEPGDSLGDWSVTNVTATGITLARGEDVRELVMPR